MKTNSTNTWIAIAIFLLLGSFLSSCAVMKAASESVQEMMQEHDARYGSGSSADLLNSSNIREVQFLSPFTTRVNKLYDLGKISRPERDRRKRMLAKSYQKFSNKEITESKFYRIANSLCE